MVKTGFDLFFYFGGGGTGPYCIAHCIAGLELMAIILPQDYKHEPPYLILKLWSGGAGTGGGDGVSAEDMAFR